MSDCSCRWNGFTWTGKIEELRKEPSDSRPRRLSSSIRERICQVMQSLTRPAMHLWSTTLPIGLVGVNRCLNRTKPRPYTTVCHHWQNPPCPPLSKGERKPPGDLSEQIMCMNLMWCDLVRIQPSLLRSARARGPPGGIYRVSRNAMISRCCIQ